MATASEMLLQFWGNQVKRLRGERSQTWLAEAVGCDQTTISRIERGRYNLSVELMVGIAAVFECELEDVFSYPPGLVSREIFERMTRKQVAS